MKYPYWKIAPEQDTDPWIRRPLIRVKLTGPKRSLDFVALIDSGADHSLFHVEVAHALGIDLSSCAQSTVAGIEQNPAPCFVTQVRVEAEHLAPITIPVMFWERQPISLIGQVGFFDQNRVKFERDHDTFEITPIH